MGCGIPSVTTLQTAPRDALGATSGIRDRDAVFADVEELMKKRDAT